MTDSTHSGLEAIDVVGMGPVSWDRFLLLPRLPGPDERIRAIRVEELAGGMVAIALVALRRWRLHSRLASVVGLDDDSSRILADLTREGVETGAVVRREDAEARSLTILVDNRNGSRHVITGPRSEAAFPGAAIPAAWIESARVLYLDSSVDVDPRTLLHSMQAEGHRLVIGLGDGASPGLVEKLSAANLILGDAGHATSVTEQTDPSQAAYALHLLTGVPTYISAGSHGSYYVNGRETFHQPSHDVPIVDRTGSNALFHAAIIYGLLAAWEPLRILKFANWVASMACREVGIRKGIPTESQIRQFIHEENGG